MINKSNKHKNSGFTLVEVIVALFILAMGMAAVISTVGNVADQTRVLQEKTFAHWVAMNKMAEYRIEKRWLRVGTTDGEANMAEREWVWQTTVTETSEEDMRRIDIRVAPVGAKKDTYTTLLTGFITKQ